MQRKEQDIEDAEIIRVFLGKHLYRYGYRRTTMELARRGIAMNHKRVARIMELFGMHARIRKANPYRSIFKRTAEHSTFENLLERNFHQPIPKRVAGTDITYIPFKGGFVYLSAVKDYATGEILAWSVSLHIDMYLVTRTLDMLEHYLGKEMLLGFLLHSDQGCHYTSPQYFARLAGCGIIQLMSRKATCIDNASIESFFGHMKDDIDISSCKTFEDVRAHLATYITEYNNEMRQWEKKKMTPVQYRDHLFALATA